MTDLDEVLERFQRSALEYGAEFSNHGPMAAEALVALGHPALLTGWVDLYAPRLPPFEPGVSLDGEARRSALGVAARGGDWVATWEAELSDREWRVVLREAVRDLAPGLFAAAGHGWLRVAHAVRALERGETAIRLRELAFGLGYWSSCYHPLPDAWWPQGGARSRPARVVLRDLAPFVGEAFRAGSFSSRVRGLEEVPGFAAAVAEADLDGEDPMTLVEMLCREGARLYLRYPGDRVVYAHAVTIPSALRIVAPLVDDASVRCLSRVAFLSVAALHAITTRTEVGAAPDTTWGEVGEVDVLVQSPDEIRYRAACSLHEHAIKLAEACLREDAISPDPMLRRAAADAALALNA